MKTLLVIILLVLVGVLMSESAIIEDSVDSNLELFHYRNRVRIVTQLLAKICPDELRHKRDSTNSETSVYLRIDKQYLQALVQKLIECERKNNVKTSLDPTDITTTTNSAAETTTSPVLLPSQCLSATNLTESWRMDHDGK